MIDILQRIDEVAQKRYFTPKREVALIALLHEAAEEIKRLQQREEDLIIDRINYMGDE